MAVYEVVAYETIERKLLITVEADNEEEALDRVRDWDDSVNVCDAENIYDNSYWLYQDEWTAKEINVS